MRYGNSQPAPSVPGTTVSGSTVSGTAASSPSSSRRTGGRYESTARESTARPAGEPSKSTPYSPKIAPHRFVDRGRDPATITALLASALRRPDLRYQFERYQFVLHWKDIVGEELANVTKPECLKQERLVIRVSSSAWAQEISFRKAYILNRLMPYLRPEEVVRDIYLLVGGEEKRR